MAAVAVKKGPTAKPRKGKGHLRPTQDKRDDDIIHTNDSSIVSKRSVSKLYFPNEPDFYEPVTAKFVRRNPLINRGYWLRMHAIEKVVLRFLSDDNGKPKIVVNLGCGYDPLPFQFWYRHGSQCQNATFVDVDYPQLIEKKRDRMLRDGLLRDPLLKTNLRSSSPPVYLRSEKYAAIGCDLKQLDVLEEVLKTEFDMASSSILFIAEVSVTYMPATDANALVAWAGKFADAHFCLLEQFLPQGPDHPFAATMLKHFNKLQTPIQAVAGYPSLALQNGRFTNAGWPQTTIRNLWDLWSDEAFTPSALRRSLDAVEPFDEWEEFALFAGHYFLLVASNTQSTYLEKVTSQAPSDTAEPLSDPSVVLAAHVPGSLHAQMSSRRFGAGFSLDGNTIAVHGGQGVQHRLSSVDVLSQNESAPTLQPLSKSDARICHTITNLSNSSALLVGGRTSPVHALSSCWYLQDGAWQHAGDVLPGRFRHSAVRIYTCRPGPGSEFETASSEPGVLIFGGKTSAGVVLDEVLLWTPNQGWQAIPAVGGPRPSARFGAAICSTGPNNDAGIILGGMDADGNVLGDVWEYNISRSAESQMQIEFRECGVDCVSSQARRAYARFGASLVPFGEKLLLVGGIAAKEILGLAEEFVVLTVGEKVRFEVPQLSVPKGTWPLLVGAGVSPVSKDKIMVAGGGAVCFSMGSFWNDGYLTITNSEKAQPQPWTVSVVGAAEAPKNTDASSPQTSEKTKSKTKPKKKQNGPKQKTTTIPRITINSASDFTALLSASKPAIITGLELGPCTSLWTLDYLKSTLGADRDIVIHTSTAPHMTFASKNFTYDRSTIGTFLDGIAAGARTYLRAVSAAQPNKLPTKLEDDFPTIAADFKVPDVLWEEIKETYHSSPLRISGPVSLWLHYDVLANILCQIRGTKTLHLYPPSDVAYLDYPAGGSSSNTNVLTSSDPRLHPHIAFLKPGDVLFIPPMWSHAATPEDGHSVAVNVFFRNLEGKAYAAGKDVYGNRDLAAYENGRRDVERIVRAFRDVPGDVKGFYLERLARELREKGAK